MSFQLDPPVTLDPSQDTGHQLAFINQNFLNLSTALNQILTNSTLNIITSGSVFMPSKSAGAGLITTRTASVSYTLPQNYTPLVLATTQTGTGTYFWQGFVPLTFGVGAGSGVTIDLLDILNMTPSSTSTTFSAQFYNGMAGTQTAPSYTITYYVLQQSSG